MDGHRRGEVKQREVNGKGGNVRDWIDREGKGKKRTGWTWKRGNRWEREIS